MPADRKAAYYNPQCKIKVKPDRVRGTISGDQVHYPGVTAAYVAHLETIRILLNAAASEDAEISTADISDFYLGTPTRPKRVHAHQLEAHSTRHTTTLQHSLHGTQRTSISRSLA